MKALFFLILLTASAGAATNETPRLRLVSPMDYQVFQRQNKANGAIVVESFLDAAGHAALTNLDRLEARLLTDSNTNESSVAWRALPFDNRVRHFRTEISAPAGGWYQLEIRVLGRSNVICAAKVEHVGVGEIFVVAGQSNSANHGEKRQQPKSPLVAAFGNGIWQPAGDPEPGASGTGGSFLPTFGDAVVARFHVPVGLVAIGVGSTSVREWLPGSDAMAAPTTTGANTILTGAGLWVSSGVLFDRIVAVERQFGTNGFRAVLWHQGESDAHQAPDREISPAQYGEYLRRVIVASRAAAGWRVPWFVAQVSYHSPTDTGSPELRAAQQSLVKDGTAVAGPNTDELGSKFREKNGRGIHFNERGLQRHGELWFEAVSPWLTRELEGTR